MRRVLIVAAALLGVYAAYVLFVRSPVPPPLPGGTRADHVLIEKSARRLTLFANKQPLRSYSVSLGKGGVAPKQHEGDGRTPEGRYIIDARNGRSAFHLALHISYPNAADTAAAQARGESAGSNIMIHGLRNQLRFVEILRLERLHLLLDWTEGCIAVTNAEIEEIWRVVPDGTPVEIVP